MSREYLYIGEADEDSGLSIYVHNITGKVVMFDGEYGEQGIKEAILLANSLEELIYNLE